MKNILKYLNRTEVLIPFVAIVGLLWVSWLYKTAAGPPIFYLKWLPPYRTAFMSNDSSDKIEYKWVSIKKISPYLKQAVILAEDDQFFEHDGIDTEAIKKAAEYNWKKGKYKRGGSTITMQLAKNLYLSPTKSVFRKMNEILIAFELERELSKDRILELYLNVAEWGEGIYGAEAAANHYFKKKAVNLSKHESAFLAAILPRPKYFDKHRGGPYLQRRTATIEGRL